MLNVKYQKCVMFPTSPICVCDYWVSGPPYKLFQICPPSSPQSHSFPLSSPTQQQVISSLFSLHAFFIQAVFHFFWEWRSSYLLLRRRLWLRSPWWDNNRIRRAYRALVSIHVSLAHGKVTENFILFFLLFYFLSAQTLGGFKQIEKSERVLFLFVVLFPLLHFLRAVEKVPN